MLQLHSGSQVATIWGLCLDASSNLISTEQYGDGSINESNLKKASVNISTIGDFYNKTHTIRLTVKEGTGSGAFIKVELDGVKKYYRDGTTDMVGSYSNDDYIKFAGIYDWNNAMVNGNASNHNRKFQLVTESFRIYDVTGNPAQ